MAEQQDPADAADGARAIAAPGDFPAVPSIAIDAPEGWEPFVWAGALLGARRGAGGAGFAPNVLVTFERWPGEVSDADGQAVLRARIRQAKGRELDADAGLGGLSLGAEQRDPQLGPMLVRYRQIVRRRGVCTDVVTAVGTCTQGQRRELGEQLRTIVESLRVDAADVAAGLGDDA